MRFEIGKYYKHTSGQIISIIGCVESTMYGKTLVAEHSDRPDFSPIGYNSDEYAQNWVEVDKEEWLKCFC